MPAERVEPLGFVAVGVAAALGRALVVASAEELLAFKLMATFMSVVMTCAIACGPSAIRCSSSGAIVVSLVVIGVPLGRRTPMRDSLCPPRGGGQRVHSFIASEAISRRQVTPPRVGRKLCAKIRLS